MKETTYIIAMGSNLASAFVQLSRARELLEERLCSTMRYSSALLTAPLGGVGSRQFANQLSVCRVALTQQQVEKELKGIERELGRNDADTRLGVIHVDLDLLSANGRVLRPDDWQRPYIQSLLQELQ